MHSTVVFSINLFYASLCFLSAGQLIHQLVSHSLLKERLWPDVTLHVLYMHDRMDNIGQCNAGIVECLVDQCSKVSLTTVHVSKCTY